MQVGRRLCDALVRVHSGDLKLGLLTVMVMYAGKVYRPLSAIARQGSRISKALARADRVAEILAADDVLDDPQNGYNGGRATGEIQLDGVVFGYDRERPALHGLSLFIPAGQRVAVIGRSGAGKSTLAALIARFYDPFDGSVRIDGREDGRRKPIAGSFGRATASQSSGR